MDITISTFNYINTEWDRPIQGCLNLVHKTAVAIAALVAIVATPIFALIDLCRLPCSKEREMSAISILDFYQGGRNDRGATLEDIWNWDDTQLEDRHDFIQWLFPTIKGSNFNPTAAVTSDETIAAFKADKALQDKMVRSLDVMLKFYGFNRTANGIEIGTNFKARAQNWLKSGDHNHLRISRILTSLRLHGLEDYSKSFFQVLKQVYRAHSDKIGAKTFSFWQSAAN